MQFPSGSSNWVEGTALIKILNPFVGPNYEGDKWLVLDILAVDEQGRRFNVEMQTSIPAGLRQRLAYYDARLYVEQMREGDLIP